MKNAVLELVNKLITEQRLIATEWKLSEEVRQQEQDKLDRMIKQRDVISAVLEY